MDEINNFETGERRLRGLYCTVCKKFDDFWLKSRITEDELRIADNYDTNEFINRVVKCECV
jgi:hypothetical protein